TGWLETWQVGVIVLSRAVFLTFLNPAFTAAVATLIPKQHYGRAVGMMQASQSVAQIAPPLLAGFLTVRVGINWIILIDLITYVFALIVLQQTRFAEIVKGDASGSVKNSLLGQAVYGWTYIRERPGLLALQLYFTAINFALSITQALLTPMI